jgi:ABC-type multidrug transport system fused ATPase/permease subunit
LSGSVTAALSPDDRPTIGGVRGFVQLARRFVPYAIPYWDKLLLRILYKQANAMIGVLGAVATIRIVDGGIIAGDTETFIIWSIIKVILTAHILIHITIYANIFDYVLMRLNLNFKRLMFDHVQKMSLRFHQGRPIGENMYRINSDTEGATDFAVNVVPEMIERVVEVLTVVGLLLALSPTVMGLLTIYIIVYYIFSHIVVGQLYQAQHYMRRADQAVSALLQEVYTAFGISKAMARGQHDRRRYFRRLGKVMRRRLQFFGFLAVWMEGGELIRDVLVTQLCHILVCGILVITGYMTLGEFLAVIEMINLVASPLMVFIATLQRLRVSTVPAQRMLETLDYDPTVKDHPNAVSHKTPKGEISFDNVFFSYSADGPDVIKELSFKINPGQKVAIVGLSGAGKTSIFNLLMRFAEPKSGTILIDGQDLTKLRRESYMENVSVVLQENFIFSASIRDNILVGNPEATEDQLVEAIERSGLGPTIASLPEGLDTMMLEGGNLSMGQKQRIGIARAVIRDPKFLYLDEATSSLDPMTEAEILKQLREVERGRTTLMIAHHITSVKTADEILVMDKGHLVQQGTHDELIEQEGGAYQRLWNAEREKVVGIDSEEAGNT